MNIRRILPEDIEQSWDKVEALLSNTRMLNNWVTAEQLKTRLINNGGDLWVNEDFTGAAIGATYTRTDKTKTYVVEFMASEVSSKEGWSKTIEAIEQQAADWGCTNIQVKGRKGWARTLPDYKITQITLERQLC